MREAIFLMMTRNLVPWMIRAYAEGSSIDSSIGPKRSGARAGLDLPPGRALGSDGRANRPCPKGKGLACAVFPAGEGALRPQCIYRYWACLYLLLSSHSRMYSR
ncbi:hypothetical protein RSAG8_06271, partial [Rhizoctonia solani AG-8 WAC10335]